MSKYRQFAYAVAAALFASSAHAQMYGASPFQNQFYKVDIVAGTALTTTPVSVPGRTITGINAVTIDPTTNIAYAVVKASGVTGRLLITIDLPTAVGVEVGNLGDNFSSLTFRADGQLFGTTGNGAAVPETLWTIDKATATPTLAATLGNGADGEIIAYNPIDTMLYHWSGNGTVVYEKITSTPPYTLTNIPIIGTTSGETFGAVWDGCQNLFITSNISSSFNTFATDGTVTAAYGAMPDDTRGLALVGGNTCDADLSVSIATVPADPVPAGPVTINIDVHSAGLARAIAPVLTITLPPAISGAATTGCVEDPNGVPTCTLKTMFAGDTTTIAIAGMYNGTIGTVTAAVSTSSNDPQPANNSASFIFGDRIFADDFEGP